MKTPSNGYTISTKSKGTRPIPCYAVAVVEPTRPLQKLIKDVLKTKASKDTANDH